MVPGGKQRKLDMFGILAANMFGCPISTGAAGDSGQCRPPAVATVVVGDHDRVEGVIDDRLGSVGRRPEIGVRHGLRP